MHFRHRQMDRQTDTDIVAQARDVYISSRAKNGRMGIDRRNYVTAVTPQRRTQDFRLGGATQSHIGSLRPGAVLGAPGGLRRRASHRKNFVGYMYKCTVFDTQPIYNH